jgi:peptide-methionine (S)-S-oxide reductase
MFPFSKSDPSAEAPVKGCDTAIATAQTHFVLDVPLKADVPEGCEVVIFGMGCFWGVERIFWQLDGVMNTAAGYSAGETPNPTYDEVCTGKTQHNEVVRVVFDPKRISFEALLKTFWEGHDPTQGMRQGNDRGTQYRSGIYTTSETQLQSAIGSRLEYGPVLTGAGYGVITTEVQPADVFYFAEAYHQQYLAKNPNGYCGIGGTGVSCPVGLV